MHGLRLGRVLRSLQWLKKSCDRNIKRERKEKMSGKHEDDIHQEHVLGTSLVVQWLGLCLPLQGVWVPSLVGKLRCHMPHGQKAKQNSRKLFVSIKQKQYCNKFNKDVKNGSHHTKRTYSRLYLLESTQ